MFNLINYGTPIFMPNVHRKKKKKHEYARRNLFATQTENLNR